MSFFKIQAARLAQAMAQAREDALIERIGEIMGKKFKREEWADHCAWGVTAKEYPSRKGVTYFWLGQPILFVGVPKIEFTGTAISATQEIRGL